LKALANRLQDAVESMEAYPSKAIAQSVQRLEGEQQRLVNDIEELKGQLAADQITDKEDFLSKLDLVSREGRNAANALLKRLSISVFIYVEGEKRAATYFVAESYVSESLKGERYNALFSVDIDDESIKVRPVLLDTMERMVAQNEMSVEDEKYNLYKENDVKSIVDVAK